MNHLSRAPRLTSCLCGSYFSHVRVPRGNLLSRYVSVSPSGVVKRHALSQLAYGALVGGRITMVHASGTFLAIACTIATRYMAVRRQFRAPKSTAEQPVGIIVRSAHHCTCVDDNMLQVLDYPIQQLRLLRLISQAVAIMCGAKALDGDHAAVQAR